MDALFPPSISIPVVIFGLFIFIFYLVKLDASRVHEKLLNLVANDPTNEVLFQALSAYQWQKYFEKINDSYPHESRAELTKQYIIQCQQAGLLNPLTQQELS
jgi:ABC-type transport system involved in Fe-S cluster assembly fused permease/ATPase subunit